MTWGELPSLQGKADGHQEEKEISVVGSSMGQDWGYPSN
jgi:hypothetical protein